MDKSKICQRCLKETADGVHTCTPTELVRGLEQQLAECENEKHDWYVTAKELERDIAECERELTRLRKIEAAAVKATDHPTWTGDDQYNDMCALVEALKDG